MKNTCNIFINLLLLIGLVSLLSMCSDNIDNNSNNIIKSTKSSNNAVTHYIDTIGTHIILTTTYNNRAVSVIELSDNN